MWLIFLRKNEDGTGFGSACGLRFSHDIRLDVLEKRSAFCFEGYMCVEERAM